MSSASRRQPSQKLRERPLHEFVPLWGPKEIDRSLTRIAHEILEAQRGAHELFFLGILRRGFPLACRLANTMTTIEGEVADASAVRPLDVTPYRDDRPLHAVARKDLKIPSEKIDGKTVVLVDDVLCTGRTVRAALDALHTVGRPRAVKLAVLVDRGHRELPIRPDYVGKSVPTALSERILVRLHEDDGGTDSVTIARACAIQGAL